MSSRYILTAALSLVAQVTAQDTSTATSSKSDHEASPTSTSAGAAKEGGSSGGGGGGYAKPPDPSDSYAGWFVVALFGLAFVIFAYRIVILSLRHFRHLVSLTHDKQNFFREPHSAHGWFKENVLYAPLFGKKHTTEMKVTSWWGMGMMPTRFQLLVLIFIIAGNILFCLYNIPWTSSSKIFLVLLRNRTGIAATLNCIPLVLFASRNNPLVWVLDISFDSFNLIHRWFGRMIVLEAVAHVICWALTKTDAVEVGKELTKASLLINSGSVAMVAFLAIPIQASSLLRHAFYETFLHLHQALVVAAFVGVWYHLRGLKEHVYIEAVVASWAIERVLRFITLAYRNFGTTRTTATIEVLPGEAMRVTLNMARPWQMRSGQHMFLTVPSVGLWTSHPFSVAWSSEEPTESYEMSSKNVDKYDTEKGLSKIISTDEILSTGGKHTVSAIVRARSGFTKSLLHKAMNAPQEKITLPALVEGPYGQAHTMASYGTVLLFAGGVGITHSLPYVRSLVAGAAGHTVATRRVTLVWIIQSPEHLEWVRPWMTSILAMEGRRETLRVEIFITRPRSAREVRSPSSTVRMYAGRPSISEIVSREAQSAVGAMGVSVCGPGGLGDDVRKSVRSWCGVGEVDLLEEAFSW